MAYCGLSNDERKELADQMGQLVSYFSAATFEARRERDEALVRNAELEALVERYRRDGVAVTDLAAVA